MSELASEPSALGELASEPSALGELASEPSALGELASEPSAQRDVASGPSALSRAEPRTLRATRQRAAVSALLDRLEDFRSAQEIHEELRRGGDGIGLTTVYRTLQTLAEAGQVDVLRTAAGEAVYRRCTSESHHHHLVCRRCGAAVEIEGPAVESWAERVAAEHGFTELSHTVEIFGICRDCAGSAA